MKWPLYWAVRTNKRCWGTQRLAQQESLSLPSIWLRRTRERSRTLRELGTWRREGPLRELWSRKDSATVGEGSCKGGIPSVCSPLCVLLSHALVPSIDSTQLELRDKRVQWFSPWGVSSQITKQWQTSVENRNGGRKKGLLTKNNSHTSKDFSVFWAQPHPPQCSECSRV